MIHISSLSSKILYNNVITLSRLNDGVITPCIEIEYGRLLQLAYIISDSNRFRHIFHKQRNGELLTAHIGGGIFLSVCDLKYGVRLGYFHKNDNNLLVPSGFSIHIYSEEWTHFHNIICDYAREMLKSDLKTCRETKMHHYWKKYWGGCDECNPFGSSIMLSFDEYK